MFKKIGIIVILLLFFLFIFSIPVHAENGGYIIEPHNPQNDELIDTSGADATISFWDLPLRVKTAYISGLLLAFLGLFKIIPVVLGRIENILENKSRQSILKYILSNPGCTIAEISDQQKINRGSVKYHIHRLKSEGKIAITKMGKFSRLFQNSRNFNDNEQVIISHLKNETSRILLWAILENPGVTNQELGDNFCMAKSTVHWHIQRFYEGGLVTFEQDGKFKKLFLGTDAETILLKIIPANQPVTE